MHTILGSGGIIASELAKALTEYTPHIRLVSRHPERVNPKDELLAADLLNPLEVDHAVAGSKVVYVTIGFPYSAKIWQRTWPTFMGHVIKACKEHGCKLVFFDNIYMYDDGQLDGMTENTLINPPSKKGKVRAQLVHMIMGEVKNANLTALIARCADYYGPGITRNGMLREMVFKNLAKGKKANWLGSAQHKHSFTYTPDAGKATALLGNTDDAYNQVWHLPTATDPYTGKQWIEHIAQTMGVTPKIQVAPKFLVRLMGVFIPIMREMVEMLYQYDRDYVFDSSKFEKRFNFTPTPYTKGIQEVVRSDYSHTSKI
ncbi:NAD-dependent epimerase/dehydratase family protein [Flavobacteriaceae bacterium 3-367]